MFRLCQAFLTGALVFASLASTAQAYTNCGAARDAVIDLAKKQVIDLIPVAKSEAAAAKSKVTTYTTWFGAYDTAREAYVQTQLDKSKALLNSSGLQIRCGTSVDANCVQGMSAYVDVSVSRKDITLCDPYFNELEEVRRGMLLHEVIHLLISNPGDPHPQLSESDAKALATANPAEAIKSAYNYQFWFR